MTSERVDSEVEADGSPTRRRLPGWVILVTLLVIVVAVCLPPVVRYQRQSALVQKLQDNGVMVLVSPRGPLWLWRLIGDDYFEYYADITAIVAHGAGDYSVSNDELNQILGESKLEWLTLSMGAFNFEFFG